MLWRGTQDYAGMVLVWMMIALDRRTVVAEWIERALDRTSPKWTATRDAEMLNTTRWPQGGREMDEQSYGKKRFDLY